MIIILLPDHPRVPPASVKAISRPSPPRLLAPSEVREQESYLNHLQLYLDSRDIRNHHLASIL